MFEDATFHSSNVLPNQTPKWMLLALAVNLTVLSALIALPLIYPEGLPVRLLQRALYAPAPPLEVRPQRTSQSVVTQTSAARNPFTAPPQIPPTVRMDADAPSPIQTIGDLNTAVGEVPGSVGTDVSIFHSDPPKVVHPAQPQRVAISGGVTEGMLLYRTTPIYPALARAANISGTVVLAATISKAGTIENLRVQSGSPMLRGSAIDAVQHWRYRPYLLNSQPVEVETTINVVFSMGGR